MDNRNMSKIIFQSVKIGIGSSLAMILASTLGLEYASSAGIITFLTILSTKWETLRLAIYRVFTFAFSVGLIFLIRMLPLDVWIEYGIFIILICIASYFLGWGNTISTNAVVATHLLMADTMSAAVVANELWLVLIGIFFAVVSNLIQRNVNSKENLIKDMHYVETKLKEYLGELASYLRQEIISHSVWDDIIELENHLDQSVKDAYEYQENTIVSHPEYYINYFKMRQAQCTVLHNLHYEMRKIRVIPSQANAVADYLDYMKGFVSERADLSEPMMKLKQAFRDMKNETMPVTREEFESRALLYHIMMDIEEFVVAKQRFLRSVNDEQRRIYWGKDTK